MISSSSVDSNTDKTKIYIYSEFTRNPRVFSFGLNLKSFLKTSRLKRNVYIIFVGTPRY